MIVTPLSPLIFWAVREVPTRVQEQLPCLSFYGSSSSGKHHFYGTPDSGCAALVQELWSTERSVLVEQKSNTDLVWFEQDLDALDPSLSALSGELVLHASLAEAVNQQVLDAGMRTADVLYEADGQALVRLDKRVVQNVELQLPRFWQSIRIPGEPMDFVPVPPSSVDRVRRLLSAVDYDPVVDSLVNSLSVYHMKKDIRYLTGEDPKSPITTRHSFSDGAVVAANWLKDRFEETGASCELKPFIDNFAPNVICSYPATLNTTETIVFSAHYDSRGSFGNTRAPGGDDDGSGTIAVLAIARAIKKNGVKFKKNVQLCAFAGEEQGLLGSRSYASELREADADVSLMVQADMLAYHKAGEPAQLGLPATIGTPEVAQLVANFSAIYSPELHVGFTSACCSDHQSFHTQGYAATQVFERAGPIADPMYHNSGDLSEREGYDLEQVKSIAKVQFATLLHAAGFELPDSAA